MSTPGLETAPSAPPIAGFWIRLLAQVIDAAVWAFSTSLLGWALVFLAPNTFGMASAFPEFRSCTQLNSVPPGIHPPAGLTPNAAVHCSKSFFGAEFRNEVILIEQHREGSVTTTKNATYVVGRDLRPKAVFDLDWLFTLAFLVYVIAAQGLDGATLGKRTLRLRVIGQDGGPPGWRAALIRNLVLLGPVIVALIFLLPLYLSGAFFTYADALIPLLGVLLLAVVVIVLQVWWTASHGRPSIHDRLAGTRVVRLPRTDLSPS